MSYDKKTQTDTTNSFKLSDQALGAIMMALQRSLLEQTDIVPVLKEFELIPTDGQEEELLVINPPVVKYGENSEED
tara:strand:+ start:279 stop:506 length:228 start_codon:yes stop_codon:yes gene_type:complete